MYIIFLLIRYLRGSHKRQGVHNFPLLDHWCSFLFVYLLFPWFYIFCYQLSYHICIHILSYVEIYMHIVVFIIIIVDLYSLLKLHLGLACIPGVFFAHIYVVDSCRVSVSTYFEKQGVIDLLAWGFWFPFELSCWLHPPGVRWIVSTNSTSCLSFIFLSKLFCFVCGCPCVRGCPLCT